MASRRHIGPIGLFIPVNNLIDVRPMVGLLSKMKQYICCFMRATPAMNNIYKLITLEINLFKNSLDRHWCTQELFYDYVSELGLSGVGNHSFD